MAISCIVQYTKPGSRRASEAMMPKNTKNVDTSDQSANGAIMSNTNNTDDLSDIIHEICCQPMREARNGGYAQAKDGTDDELVELIDRTEETARRLLLVYAAAERQEARKQLRNELLAAGHGGGNWRRLVMSIGARDSPGTDNDVNIGYGYSLELCVSCGQMTNHIDSKCQKCK